MDINNPLDGFERALATVPACALQEDAREAQKARYRTIAQAAIAVWRAPGVVLVDFDERLDDAVVGEVVAVERECCPSLRFEFDPIARRLSVTVGESAMLPALDAIEAAFAGAVR